MADPAPGHPEVLRIIAPNPGPMTLAGTNTYVVGSGPAWVIDPGPDDPDHLAAVREAGEQRGGIEGVLLTHGHTDHTDGVAELGVPVVWGEPGRYDEVAAFAVIGRGGDPQGPAQREAAADPGPQEIGPFTVIPTPGHASDHVVFVYESVCFCGDLVLGEGSSIVPPAAVGGSLADYLRSLEVLEGVGAGLLAPGHGPWVTEPAAKIRAYREHRLERERRLVAALARGERSRERLLDEVWDDVPEVLRPAAAVAMQAHLEKLEAEGALPEPLDAIA